MANEGFYFAVPAVDIFLPETEEDRLSPDEQRAALVLRDQQLEDYLASITKIGIYGVSNTTGFTNSSTADPAALPIIGAGNASVGWSAGSFVISAAAAGAGNQSVGVVGLGNTAGTTGYATGGNIRIALAGGNNITLSQSLNGASATVTVSAPSQTAQTLGIYGSSQTTGGASSTTVDARSMTLVGAGGVSVGATNGSWVISGATGGGGGAAGSQTVGMSNLGNTAGTSGVASGSAVQLLVAGGNNITVSQSLSGASATLTISGPNTSSQSVQTQNVHNVSLSGNTSGTMAQISSGTWTLAGGNNVTLSQSGNAVTISAASIPAQTVQTQNLHAATLAGNTAGTLALVSSGTATWAGGNNITLSQVGNAITVSGASIPAQTVQTQNLHNLTLGGNTAGTLAQVSSGTLTLAGGNNITLSQSGNAITVSAASIPTQSVQTQNLHAMTVAGNTAGTLALVSSGTATWAGGNNITLSQSGNAVTISGASIPAQTVQTLGVYASSQTTGASSSATLDARSVTLVGQGGVSVGASNGSILLSGATGGGSQSVQTLGFYGSSQTTGGASSTTLDARSVTFAGQGLVSVGASAGSILVRASLSGPTLQQFTTGSGTYSKPAGCTAIFVEIIGGGGGGGGVAAAVGSAAGAGGGGAGAYACKLITNPAATYAYTVGPGGGGGAAGNNNGSAGTGTTFGAPTVISAAGGGGGTGMAAGTAIAMARGGADGTGTTGGDFSAIGQDGSEGFRFSASGNLAGKGGGNPFGGGGRAQDGNGAGVAATTPGGGGAGGCSANSATARAGGAGANGMVRVTEHYG